MKHNKYLILITAIGLLYYALFKCKDRLIKLLCITISISSIAISILYFAKDYSILLNGKFEFILNIIIFTALFLTFCVFTVMALKHRKNPEKKKYV